jgi:polysaccharide export outer membrane protein
MSLFKAKRFFIALSLITYTLSSCQSYKNVPYYKDLDKKEIVTEKVTNNPAYLIHTGDILGINITSRNPESAAIFNYNLARVNGNSYNTRQITR